MTSSTSSLRRARHVAIGVAPVLALGLLVGTAPASVGVPSAPAAAAPARVAATTVATSTVTLITGDVVHLRRMGATQWSAEIERPTGARGGVRSEQVGDAFYVIPDEALPYLASHRLDRRLFDVAGLVAQGYDDEHSAGLPLIVRYTSGKASQQKALPGATRLRTLRSVSGAAVRATKSRARSLWTTLTPARSRKAAPTTRSVAPATGTPARVDETSALLGSGVESVWLDGRVHAQLAQSTAQIGAAAAWAGGLDGAGVKVAVLDTGYDVEHPDLAGRVSLSRSFVPDEGVDDGHGHGTHTASTVGGSGAASDGREKGVAPGADLIIGKVLADGGYGDDSWVIAGMEWAAQQGARVISMSLGGDVPSNGTEPMCQALDDISADTGALFVVAAGNNGNEGTMSCPGAATSALTVAAVDETDTLAGFSSRGPRAGDYGLKPDIAAPGVDILAAKAGGDADTGWYQSMSGTSMATPHVAGAAAIVFQQHPGWTGAQVKDALMSTSLPLAGRTAYEVGAGRVDLGRTTAATVTATGSAYFGFVAWPHPDPAPLERTLSWSNSSDVPVTLALEAVVGVVGGPYDVDPGADAGTPAPEGLVTLSRSSITVPAHGTAGITATAHPALGQSARRYAGQVVATDPTGAVRARTQIGLYEEEERYDVDVEVHDRTGAPAPALLELQKFGDIDPTYVAVGDTGRLSMRLLPGTYSVVTYLEVAGGHGRDSRGLAQLGAPEIVVDHDQTVDLDARRAREVSAVVPRVTEDRALYLDWYRSDGGTSTIASQYLLPPYIDTMYALPTGRVTRGSFEFEARWRKAFPALTLTDGSRPVRVLLQPGTSLYDGSGRLRLIDAGTGGAGEYAGLRARGAIALVRRSAEVEPAARVAAAAGAGVALLVVVNDSDKPLGEWVGSDTGGYSAVPVASVTSTTGGELLARAAARGSLSVRGVPDSPYVYDLAAPFPDRIPASLTYRPRPGELAVVDMRFHGSTTRTGGEFRWDYRPYRQYGFGAFQRQTMPSTRVDYVSTQPGVRWSEAAVTGPDLEWVTSAETHALRAGRRTTNDFFGAVAHPANGGAFWSSERYDGWIAFNVQPWADGAADRAGYMQTGDTRRFRLYSNGQKLSDSEWPPYVEGVPSGPVRYRLLLEASRDASVYDWSTRTRTEWVVRSPGISNGAESVDLLPVLQVGYDVTTDLGGRAPAGRQSIGVTVSHLAGAFGAGRVARPGVEVSFDGGRTWRAATVAGASGAVRATFVAPRHAAVSLRVSGHDDRGNRVSQTVIRAYGVR